MREESGSEEDSGEPVEWEDDDEVSSEEDGSKVVFIPIRLRNQIWDKYHFSGTQLWQRRAGRAKGREFIMPPRRTGFNETIHAPGAAHPDRGRWGLGWWRSAR